MFASSADPTCHPGLVPLRNLGWHPFSAEKLVVEKVTLKKTKSVIWLVVQFHHLMKNMSSTMGRGLFPISGKIRHVPNHQVCDSPQVLIVTKLDIGQCIGDDLAVCQKCLFLMSDHWQAAIKLVIYGGVHTCTYKPTCSQVPTRFRLQLVPSFGYNLSQLFLIKNINERIHHRYLGA